jgi:hypothetical protein
MTVGVREGQDLLDNVLKTVNLANNRLTICPGFVLGSSQLLPSYQRGGIFSASSSFSMWNVFSSL